MEGIRPQEWAPHQIDRTRRILESVDVVAFSIQMGMPNKGCSLDHLDGRFGYVRMEDALAYNWRVFDYKTDELHGQYQNLDELIAGGWKVST